MKKLKVLLLALSYSHLILLTSCSSGSDDAAVFEIKFENVSKSPSFTAQNNTPVVTALSSLIGVVHTQPNRIFTLSAPDQGRGTADLAENGDPSVLAQSLRLDSSVEIVGIANDPSEGVGGILAPGQSFTLILSTLDSNARLSLATSFLQANDIILSTRPEGVALFDANGTPLSGNITSFFNFYDLGTEVNQAPGIGSAQVIRQGAAPTGQTSEGTRENGVARVLADGFTYPSVVNTIRVTVTPIEFGNIVPTPTPAVSLSPSPSASASASNSPTASSSPSSSPSSGESSESSSSPTPSPSPQS